MPLVGKGLFAIAVITTLAGGILTLIVMRALRNPIMETMPSAGGMKQA